MSSPAAGIHLAIAPFENDPTLEHDAQGRPFWRSKTCDSAFIARVPEGHGKIAKGWYVVTTDIVQLSGRIAGPRFYVPLAGGGYSKVRSVEFQLKEGKYSVEVFVATPADEFRFDPSIYPCEFECEGLQLAPALPRPKTWGGVVDLVQALRRLRPAQLAMWIKLGFGMLRKRGPRAVWDAAVGAIATHVRAVGGGYPDWLREFMTPSAEDLVAMREESERFARQPVMSFITPVYNPPEPFLRAMIESVLAQAYPRWELCMADDASTAPHVRPILEEYSARDPRIKVAWREKNGHISAASNTALGLATGDFVALLDHDDAIPPDALYWVVREINEHPDTALLYSDEDKLGFAGERLNPYFKSDWNYDLFLSHNLVTHLGVYRADIVRELGGFREGFEGAQDYDLALRFIERIQPSQIRHIPRLLYHWRMLAGSTAIAAGEKGYAAARAQKAVQEHVDRMGIAATVESIPDMGVQRVRYHVKEPAPLASILIPTRNGEKLVRQCIESIRAKTTYKPYEIVLVDNGSDDAGAIRYFRSLRDQGIVRLLEDPLPFNFSRINNEAAREARGEYLVFLNNDIEVITPEWLTELVSQAQRLGIGAVGAKLWYPNDTIQHAGLVLVMSLAAHAHQGLKRGDHGYLGRASLIQAISAVTGACLCVRKTTFDQVGGFDEALAVAFNDVDLCLRLQAAGFRNLYTPYAQLYHYESATRGYEDTDEKVARFKKEADILRTRWMPVLMNDPYYSPNLSLSSDPFTVAWPPRVERFKPDQAARPANRKP